MKARPAWSIRRRPWRWSGLIDDEKHITTQWFKNDGDVIILVGSAADDRRLQPGRVAFSQGLSSAKKTGPVPSWISSGRSRCKTAVRDLIRLVSSRARTIAAKAAWRSHWRNAVSIPLGCSAQTLIAAVALRATRTRLTETRLQPCSTNRNRASSFPAIRRMQNEFCPN